MRDDAEAPPGPQRRGRPAARPRAVPQAPAEPIGGVESVRLFERSFAGRRSILLAVSGGADSTALLVLAGEYSQTTDAPTIAVATVDHGLRPEAREEADAVAALADRFGLDFARLDGKTAPRDTRIEETARVSRYAALLGHARLIGADAIATAHTLDDQAETVLMRLSAGSGPMGLAAMRHAVNRDGIELLRPLLGMPKARLVATLEARNIVWAEDPMNVDPRFARSRLRAARPALEREGMTAERLGVLAFRMARVNAAIEAAIDDAVAAHVTRGPKGFSIAATSARLPDEIKLRLLGRVIAQVGGFRVKLERLERLADRIVTRPKGASTLADARIGWAEDGVITVSKAPPRRGRRPDPPAGRGGRKDRGGPPERGL